MGTMEVTAMFDETTVKACDLMQTDVVKLHCDTPIERAVETLDEYGISGAPVIDDGENLVGVLTASDIVSRDHVRDDRSEDRSSGYYRSDPLDEADEIESEFSFSREDYDPEVLERETVADWMTPAIISVKPDDSLSSVCGVMVREGIHRVFVVEDRRLLGVISSFDIVRFLAERPAGR
jgi:predicted transcriptional regulator